MESNLLECEQEARMTRSLDGWLDMQLRQARDMYIKNIPCPTYADLAEATGASIPSIKLAAQRDDWAGLRAQYEQELIAKLRDEMVPTYQEKHRLLVEAELEMKRELLEMGMETLKGYQFKNPQEAIDAIAQLSAVIGKDINLMNPTVIAKSKNPTNPDVANLPNPQAQLGMPTALVALIHRGTQSGENMLAAIEAVTEPQRGTINAFFENTIHHSDPDDDLVTPDDDRGIATAE